MPDTSLTEPAVADPVDETEELLRLGLVVDLDAGFAEVLRVHERVVHSVALRLTRRPEDAEDLAADAFLRAYRALCGYDAARIRELRLRPWLLTILRNTARNAARDASRRPGPPPVFEPAEEAVAGPSVEEQVEQDDARHRWGLLLARLPDAQRMAVVLRHVEGLPTSEVAEILGCPDGTAKSHISRGLARLRGLVAEHGGELGLPTSSDPDRIHDPKEGSMTLDDAHLGGLDPVRDALARLAAPAPSTLRDKVFTAWLAAPSRLGEVFVAFTGDGVQFVRPVGSLDGDPAAFADAYRRRFARPLRTADRAPAGLLPALRGHPTSTVPLDLGGLSDFERGVLAATRRIPAGQTRPYGWIAREAGSPRAVRAVGTVLARNPVPLLVPCHRVVRADGAVGQYMFGTAHKEALLRGEDVDLDEVAALARGGVHFLGSDTTHIVCFPTCHNARRITAPHRRGFRTVAAAAAVGYRPCRTCRPAAAEVPA